MTERCAMRDCIAPAAETVTDGEDTYIFCCGHFDWFMAYLANLRVERDKLVEGGVERVERQEI